MHGWPLRDACLAAIAALEAHRFEVNRLWFEYFELADPVRARKIRRILKRGEQGAAKTQCGVLQMCAKLLSKLVS